MSRSNIAIIGGGNMARAIAGGLIRSGYDPSHVLISEPLAKQRDVLAAEFSGSTISADNNAVAADAGTLVLAVKPQILKSVCQDLQRTVQKSMPLVISIAAGPRVDDIDRWLGGNLEIVRVMPNQPALVDQGISALYANDRTDELGRILAEKVMTAVGQAVWVEDESLLDAVTAISGTGPAYFYLLIDALIQSGIRLGIDPDIARTLAVETARGAATLAAAEAESMSALIERVRSPGGTTTAAFERLDAADVRGIFDEAIEAAKNRSIELARKANDDGYEAP
jgi:pyrroline-5-carboxylate reductase